MPNWAGSSWYFLRYVDPHNSTALASAEKMRYWTPVDWYNGGMEHTTLHLLYSRFWHKFLFDIGIVPTTEPYSKRTSHGLILGETGEKMSKSRGNVVNPNDMIDQYGADSFRLYEMFMGAFDQPIPWSTKGLNGMYRFLARVWDLKEKIKDDAAEDPAITQLVHQTIRKVSEDIEATKFNTALAQLMTLSNAMGSAPAVRRRDFEMLVVLLAPFAPHIAEELWEQLGHTSTVTLQPWPSWDETKIKADQITFVVQVNGKLRADFTASRNTPEAQLREMSLSLDKIKAYTDNHTVRKVIVVPGKLINIVVS
jgi:leucyl-tRNA synthetase